MRKSKYSEHQIVAALKRAEAGVPVKDLYREPGISSATLHQWRSKYGRLAAIGALLQRVGHGFRCGPAEQGAHGPD